MRIGVDRAIEVDLQVFGSILCGSGEARRTNHYAPLNSNVIYQALKLFYSLNVDRILIVFRIYHNRHRVLADVLLHQHIDLTRDARSPTRKLGVVSNLRFRSQLLLYLGDQNF